MSYPVCYPFYAFNKRLIPLVLNGTKTCTIRSGRTGRNRHAIPGETIHFYEQPANRPRLFALATCLAARVVHIDLDEARVTYPVTGHTIIGQPGLNAFAMALGFRGWVEVARYLIDKYPGVLKIERVHIEWGGTIVPMVA